MKQGSEYQVGHKLVPEVEQALSRFTHWLEGFGETSYDHQTFFAGPIGRRAKALYYKNKLLGTAAVAPMIFFEAFVPSARQLFHKKTRFPIADAHFAMGFGFLHEVAGDEAYLKRAIHFLKELKRSRCDGFKEYAWGYPFDWVTRNGTIAEHTPFITSTPYMYEAFRLVHQLTGDNQWREIMASIVRHVRHDFKDFPASETASTCAYTPLTSDKGGVINAAAYRSGMLAMAAHDFGDDQLWKIGERNLNFVLENQNEDGSWYYAVDGVRDFVDHFHTCFVMKALAKIHQLNGREDVRSALQRGTEYYLQNLFGDDGMPKPFSKAPRLTVYECELYDCAEAINLCLLLQDEFPAMGKKLNVVVDGILRNWITPAGSFRARRLKFGWDNVPMHRWAQSQMFRSLALYVKQEKMPALNAVSTRGDAAAQPA